MSSRQLGAKLKLIVVNYKNQKNQSNYFDANVLKY